MYKVNRYLQGISRANWFTPDQQLAIIHEVCKLKLNGYQQSFSMIAADLIFIKSFEIDLTTLNY